MALSCSFWCLPHLIHHITSFPTASSSSPMICLTTPFVPCCPFLVRDHQDSNQVSLQVFSKLLFQSTNCLWPVPPEDPSYPLVAQTIWHRSFLVHKRLLCEFLKGRTESYVSMFPAGPQKHPVPSRSAWPALVLYLHGSAQVGVAKTDTGQLVPLPFCYNPLKFK